MLDHILRADVFMPHGMCLLWRPDLMALHVVSDAVIALSYFAIPVSLFVFLHRRRDLQPRHRLIAGLFAIFITACGLTHVLSIIVLWVPLYELEGVVKAATALASLGTALVLPFLIPELLRIPSPMALAAEVEAHKATLVELEAARNALARRVARTEEDLVETTQRFETAIRNSPITVFEQDENLIYTWVFNPPLGLKAETMLGRSEADFFSAEAADALQRLKLAALSSDQPRRGEVEIAAAAGSGWFDVQVEPLALRSGRRGVIATAADITRLKRNEAGLQTVMRELNHRSKNLLTIVLSLSRQTARSFKVPKAFLLRLEERLASLAKAHDVLARNDWAGADLEAIVRGQLQHQIDTYPKRIQIEGPPAAIPPEAAHYLGMAVHELGSNAVKHGALRRPGGRILISWSLGEETGDALLRFVWRESGGQKRGAAGPAGFGSVILTRLTPRALGGSAELRLGETGAVWVLTARLGDGDPGPHRAAA
jgi:PAS domain S-box-containing protein